MQRILRFGLYLALATTSASHAQAADDLGSYNAPIVNGVVSADFPSVGALLSGSSASNAQIGCTGTLIGCETFLTAAHCVCDGIGADCQGANAPNPALYFVYLQHAGVFAVSSISVRSDFDFPQGDVAVLKLSTSVTGITPSVINTVAKPDPGQAGTIAGFGRSGGNNQDYGVKQFGAVVAASCSGGVSNTTSVCWNYSSPIGPPGSNSNTCNGDSGGPLFVDYGSGPLVAGITSGGTSDNCLPTDHSYDANVYNYRSWIQTQGGADLNNTTCGMLPAVGSSGASTLNYNSSLSAGSGIEYSFTVSPATSVLRVALNGVDDVDLYVKAGSTASASNYDCKNEGTGGFAVCEFVSPAGGTWSVYVLRFSGTGMHQLTVSRFGVDCSDPERAGEPCDDGNSCTTPDTCQSGVCSGAPVSDGTPCDDGNLCTNPDSCQAGLCAGTQSPRTSCQSPFEPTAGSVRLREPLQGEDRLSWRWLRGSGTDKAAFGDPLSATGYSLCVYDQSAGSDVLVLQKHIAPGGTCGKRPCWAKTSRGFRYGNRGALPTGITGIDLRSGLDGKAQITLRGRGPSLLPPSLPLQQDNTVTVQLGNATSCWEARYTTNKKNTELEFRASPGGL